jgi:3-keto-L-gulonate-6-phosphate decarboxylase
LERLVTNYVNRWTALFGWVALMAIVWALAVPKGLSVGTFTLLSLTGLLLLLAGRALWRSQQPSPSIRQAQASLDSEASRRSL